MVHWRQVGAVALILVQAVFMIAVAPPQQALGASVATVTVNANTVIGTLSTQISTQLVYPGVIEGVPNGLTRLQALGAPLVRIHAGTDGGLSALPAGGFGDRNNWDFDPLTSMIENIKSYGSVPVMNPRYGPNWMFTCSSEGGVGTVRDKTFTEFADYMTRLVRYYNLGSMTTETGQTITNPRGTANRIIYWELWNEPDLSAENPCHPADWGASLTPAEYVTMWNVTASRMRAADPTVKLVGPVPTNHPSLYGAIGDPNDYIPRLLRTATIKPDIVSYHGYGGWENTQTDKEIFDGGSNTGGLQYIVDGLADIQSWIAQYSPGTKVWITEMNVNSAWGEDPKQRPWNGYGAAWGASAFRRLALGGIALIHQYQYIENRQFGMLSQSTGVPLLTYWRDYHLSRYFPVGSQILSSTSDVAGVEVLAVRQAGSSDVNVLLIDRQVNNATVVGGTGLPVTVTVNVQNLSGLQSVNLRMVDNAAMGSLAAGPALVTLPISATAVVPFAGYGAAFVKFSSNASPPPTTTPTPTPTPTAAPTATSTPTPTFTPTPTPAPTATPTATPSPSASPSPSSSPPITPPPGGPTSVAYMPNLTKTLGGPEGWDTPFIVQNVGSSPTDLQLSFYRFADGEMIAQHWVPDLMPGTSYADVPMHDDSLPHDTQFSLVVKAYGSEIVTVVNQSAGSGANLQSASYGGQQFGATTVYLPNVTRRFYGYDTPFIVQNLGSATTLVTARFVSFDGSKSLTLYLVVQPGRSGVIDPDYTAGLVDGTQYAVVLTADQPIAAVVNAHNESGAPVAYTTAGLASGSAVLYGPYAAKNNDSRGLNSPVVVQNLGSAPADATIEFTKLGGGATQSFILTGIAQGGSKVFDPRFTLGTTTPCFAASATCLGPGEYSLKITATGTVGALVLPTSEKTADAYAATSSPSSRIFLPNVTRTLGGADGWTTPIALQSVGATSATLSWRRFADGAVVVTQQVTLPLGGSVWIDPRNVGGLADGTQYSVVVEGGSGGAVTAIVYEIWYGGGDGVMIYSGFSS